MTLDKPYPATGFYIRTLDRDGNEKDEFFSKKDLEDKTDEYDDLLFQLLEIKFEFENRAKGGEHHKFSELWDTSEEE